MDFDGAGPSGVKRQRKDEKTWKDKRTLSDEDLEKYLLDSDDEFADPDYTESEIDNLDDSDSDIEDNIFTQDRDISGRNSADTSPTQHTTISSELPVNWTETPSEPRPFSFTKRQELKIRPNGNRPIDYYNLLVDDTCLSLIVQQTNRYAVEVFLSSRTSEFSRITRWRDITVPEIRIFFGLFLHMGTIHLSRIQDYWKKDRLFNVPFFSAHMSRDRFMIILRCLHFAENPKQNGPQPDDRLYKIRPMIDYFNKKMLEIYYPNKNLSLDESMILWRGRLVFRQYIKNKRHKYGIKLYMLTEPDGTILKFAVYTGTLDDFGGKGHAANVVLHLMDEKLDAGHSLFLDNFYNSYHLSRKLLERNTYSTETLRLDRKDNPVEIKNAKLKKGQTISRYSNGIMVGKWRDKRDVSYISSEFSNNLVQYTNKRGQEREKPEAIFNYKFMGGIDKQDQMLSYYPCSRKTLRWYKKLGTHILQMLLLNSYFLYKKYEKKKISLYDFRLQVIQELVPPKDETSPSRPIAEQHIPEKIPMLPNKNIRPRRRCQTCYKNKIRKDTIYYCPKCPTQPSLCLGDCFSSFHESL